MGGHECIPSNTKVSQCTTWRRVGVLVDIHRIPDPSLSHSLPWYYRWLTNLYLFQTWWTICSVVRVTNSCFLVLFLVLHKFLMQYFRCSLWQGFPWRCFYRVRLGVSLIVGRIDFLYLRITLTTGWKKTVEASWHHQPWSEKASIRRITTLPSGRRMWPSRTSCVLEDYWHDLHPRQTVPSAKSA